MNKEIIKEELKKLHKDGNSLITILNEKGDEFNKFSFLYQNWYTKAMKVVEFLAPDRYDEFKSYYEINQKRKQMGYSTYVIQDYIKGIVPSENYISNFNAEIVTSINIKNQICIIASLTTRIDSIITNIDVEIKSEIYDSELETAKNLMKISVRAAGALAGVIVENHLQTVVKRRNIICSKNNPTISDLNELLKKEEVYENLTWRKISYLADIRNKCSHKKDEDPTKEQVIELIDGTNWVIKNIL